METIDYNGKVNILLSVKGHPYDRSAFFRIFEEQDEIAFTAVEQPATCTVIESSAVEHYDALVFYDMPGLDFSCQPPRYVDPAENFKKCFLELTRRGVGMVFLHHAIAGWPTWKQYGEIMGGRFLYKPGTFAGEQRLDSGYRHAVDYMARVEALHPVTAGVPAEFAATDELYLYEVNQQDITPILSSDFSFDSDHFNSAFAAVSGQGDDYPWPHSPASNLVGWVKNYNNSPIVYLQMGDAPAIYTNRVYRQLIYNAIHWVTSAKARAWAQQ